jgi:hypothetical protein
MEGTAPRISLPCSPAMETAAVDEHGEGGGEVVVLGNAPALAPQDVHSTLSGHDGLNRGLTPHIASLRMALSRAPCSCGGGGGAVLWSRRGTLPIEEAGEQWWVVGAEGHEGGVACGRSGRVRLNPVGLAARSSRRALSFWRPARGEGGNKQGSSKGPVAGAQGAGGSEAGTRVLRSRGDGTRAGHGADRSGGASLGAGAGRPTATTVRRSRQRRARGVVNKWDPQIEAHFNISR